MERESYFSKIRINTRKYLPQIILYTFAAGIAVTLFIATRKDPESQEKLVKLRQMAVETPLLPGFEKRRTWEHNKHGSAIVMVSYYSTASFGEVKDFYSNVLVAKGWGKPVMGSPITPVFGDSEKKWLTFRSGEFLIAIGKEEPSDINFVYRWER